MTSNQSGITPASRGKFDHAQHDRFDFLVTFDPKAAFGLVEDLGSTVTSRALKGIGNVVIGGTAPVSIQGGDGLSTVVLGDGNAHVDLKGALNTVILGDGNNVVNAGVGVASADFDGGKVHITDQGHLSATFAAPLGIDGLQSERGSQHNIGFFNSGTGNIGAFNGLSNNAASVGNNNIGVFNGNFNGGTNNGNNNIGAFNGNFNGLENSSPSNGNNNGNSNIGVLNGNYNGNLNTGHDTGSNNGNGNVGIDSGNLNGNGLASVALHGGGHWNAHLVGGFDTIVVGNGSNAITALAGICTIVAGNGDDHIEIGGSYNTVVAGNGADHVVGLNVDHSSIVLGNGNSTVNLTGMGSNTVRTGSGDDVISLSGTGNWVNAGTADTFNIIFGGAGHDTFVLAPAGRGTDKIFNFNMHAGDRLDLRDALVGTPWNGKICDLGHFLTTETVAGNTLLEYATGSGHSETIAELMHTNFSLAMLEAHHALIL